MIIKPISSSQKLSLNGNNYGEFQLIIIINVIDQNANVGVPSAQRLSTISSVVHSVGPRSLRLNLEWCPKTVPSIDNKNFEFIQSAAMEPGPLVRDIFGCGHQFHRAIIVRPSSDSDVRILRHHSPPLYPLHPLFLLCYSPLTLNSGY